MQVYPLSDGTSEVTWFAIGYNTGSVADQIELSLVCAKVS